MPERRAAARCARLEGHARSNIRGKVDLYRCMLADIELSFTDCLFVDGVGLQEAHVGNVAFRQCTFGASARNDRSPPLSVDAEDLRVEGDCLFQEASARSSMRLSDAFIGGRISFRDAELHNVDMGGATVRDRIAWYRVRAQSSSSSSSGSATSSRRGTALNLRLAEARELRIDSSAPEEVNFDGFVCHRIRILKGPESPKTDGGNAQGGASVRRPHPSTLDDDEARRVLADVWLKRSRDQHLEPYESFATTLRATGHGRDARRLLIVGHRRCRPRMREHPGRWLANVVGSWFDYGYRFGARALLITVLTLTIGVGAFGYANAHSPALLVATRGSEPHESFSPILYSIDVAVPVLDLRQEASWTPAGHSRQSTALVWWEAFEIVAGYALTAFAVAHFTGMLRKE